MTPVAPDDLVLCVPESYFDPELANRLLKAVHPLPKFVAIIGYSFCHSGDKYDDQVSLDFFRNTFRHFAGNIYVIGKRCAARTLLGLMVFG